jgi:hypothetical protein
MKKIIFFALLIFSSTLFSQTTISTGSVSGTWTAAGSPYIVTVPISVAAGQTLTIQPGVTVRFQPTKKLSVSGQLIAAGTAAMPIVFEATDTTGWSLQNSTTGGWHGIQVYQYAGSGTDNSILEHCIIRDVKYGYLSYLAYCNTLTCERGLRILNCKFEHNCSGLGTSNADAIIRIYPTSMSDTIEMDSCIFTDNYGRFGLIRPFDITGGYVKITNSDIGYNHNSSTIWSITTNMLFEGNLLHDNNMTGDNSPLKINGGTVTIRKNRIYRNSCYDLAAVGCREGIITIENNLICNNTQTNPSCGATGGGGGIHIAHNNSSTPITDSYYIVRNNVIANNYSAFGGGGIYVYHAIANISNNHIINNTTNSFGRSLAICDAASEVKLKNNIFYAKAPSGIVDTFNVIGVLSANTLQLEYNYLPAKFSTCVLPGSGFTLVGDTLTNTFGTAPGMIAPTANNNVATSALSANFDVMISSPCIDRGDTAGTFCAMEDYAANNRIQGTIDIGAYEHVILTGIAGEQDRPEIQVFPNPASDRLTIILPDAEESVLMLYDITGKTLLAAPAQGQKQLQLDIHTLAEGIYFVQVKTSRFSETRKIVVIK